MINKTVLRMISRNRRSQFRDFEVSTVIAYRLSEAILKQNYLNPENYLYIEDDTMILRCVVDDEDVRYRYNFNDGDFSEYKQMIDDDYLI